MFKDREEEDVRKKEKSISVLSLLRNFVILHDALCLLLHDKTEVVYLRLDVVYFIYFFLSFFFFCSEFSNKRRRFCLESYIIYCDEKRKVSNNEHESTIQQ